MAKKSSPVLWTGKQFREAELVEIDAVVQEMIPATGIILLHGQSSTGKSALAWEIANAVHSGKPLFGLLPTVKNKVLYVSLDMAQIALRVRWFGTAQNPKVKEERFNPKFHIHIPPVFPFTEHTAEGKACRKKFKKLIQPYGLIILDALGRFVGETNDGVSATEFYQIAARVFDNKACILIHHESKHGDDFSGSNRWRDFAIHQLRLTKGKDKLRVLTQKKSQVFPERKQPWTLYMNNVGKMRLYDKQQIARDRLLKAKRAIPGFNDLPTKKAKEEALGKKMNLSTVQVRRLWREAEGNLSKVA